MSRREFMMTADDMAKIMEASKPVPYLVMGGREPESPQDRANRAWRDLGERLGFQYMTARPSESGDPLRFTAEPTEQT
jgi:hypothetical protein